MMLRPVPLRAALLLVVLLSARPVLAQSCVGDCTGRGSVSISDLIVAVNIALGRASLSQCPSVGPEPVTVSRLILSVNNALHGCPATPTASVTPTTTATTTATIPLGTATETATPTQTATPTVTPTEIVSTWIEDKYDVGDNNCPTLIVTGLQQALRNTRMTFIVHQFGLVAVLETEKGDMLPATIDPDGTLHGTVVINDDAFGCDYTLTLSSSIDLTKSPTTSFYDAHLVIPVCAAIGAIDCMGEMTSRWTRATATPTVTATSETTTTATETPVPSP